MHEALPQRRVRLLVAVTVVLFMLAAAWSAATARADNYVALGDSYAAGPFIPDPVLPLGCLKSNHNYAHLAAPSIGLPLRDASCSGAKTTHMTTPQNVDPDGPNPPQFNSLAADTKVVSVTIGGNDIGFSDILESCVTYNPFSNPCQKKYVVGGVDEISRRIAAAAPLVAGVIQGIHARSPQARVFITNYPAIYPETGSGCWPQMPTSFGDSPYLRSKERELNAMIANQAAANNAGLVNWYQASIGHDACKGSSTRWVEPLIPGNSAAPVHPNASGMQGGANALVASVAAG
jgi:lysophospholipase L1-like esterase